MRNPNEVLNSLRTMASNTDYKFKRLYRNLYNPEFYYMAYSKIYAKEGNMTKGTDGKNIDGMSIERINTLIDKIKHETYKPYPARRIYRKKANGGKRPLGIPSMDDKIIQEIIRSILESIYESTFSDDSHGFRPKKSCHTALIQIQKTYRGVRWFVEGDIKGFFDNINHHSLINILKRRIDDEKFIRLIWKFLRAGYLEEWTYNNTFSGTPQGGIISPILSNIYLNELDKFMKIYKQQFDKGARRKTNRDYAYLSDKKYRLRKKHEEQWGQMSEDENYKRIVYTRYADDFLIGIIGSKEDAIQVKENLTIFLKETLELELSQEKTLITHSEKLVQFLGYDITISREEAIAKTTHRRTKRVFSFTPKLYVPKNKWIKNLFQKDALAIDKKTGTWKPKHRTYLKDNDDLEILSIYNAEIRGLYEYYKLANNVSVINKYKYIMEYSMYKTFASKYKKSVKQILNKYRTNGKFGIRYKTKNGEKIRYLYDQGFRRQISIDTKTEIDILPNTLKMSGRTSLIERLLAEECEVCGKKNLAIEIHHIRKLKDLKVKKMWEKMMIARKRKTMALCHQCHIDLHSGKLD
ncbi:group II intron reverse transcriptase/maturase [Bacillus cereus]|uniref:reverse transcriptase/maturase family protein n=1 Tax=Bacillus cereus TaxID=1396 RepID=UPI000BFE7652|nr:reverse transcriptase/maturase family protein [Bacillus cereus]PGV17268.1 group II intron reverse transcriptase/maturase [Bacillus cereus]